MSAASRRRGPTADAYPATTVDQAGGGSIERALDTMVEEDLGKSSMLSGS